MPQQVWNVLKLTWAFGANLLNFEAISALEATQGQLDDCFSQLPCNCHLEEVVSAGDCLKICPRLDSRVDVPGDATYIYPGPGLYPGLAELVSPNRLKSETNQLVLGTSQNELVGLRFSVRSSEDRPPLQGYLARVDIRLPVHGERHAGLRARGRLLSAHPTCPPFGPELNGWRPTARARR